MTFVIGYNNTFNDEIENEYDFIVVGAGSAGTAIAARLSEISSWNILLLEVGDVASIVTDGPAMAPIFQFSNYNWGYLMEKQDNVCLGRCNTHVYICIHITVLYPIS